MLCEHFTCDIYGIYDVYVNSSIVDDGVLVKANSSKSRVDQFMVFEATCKIKLPINILQGPKNSSLCLHLRSE